MKTSRITVLASPQFKKFLEDEAKREGVSVGELIRVRCGQSTEEERLLSELAAQLRKEVRETRAYIKRAEASIDRTLAELAKSREARQV
jgi:transcriptional regulator with XRE-family HTH domain